MSAVELEGFDEVKMKLERMGSEGTKIAKKAIMDNHEPVLRQLKTDAPKLTGEGARALKKCKTKTTGGSVWVYLGIDASNWNACRGIYFHHYGAYSRAGSMWVNASFGRVMNSTRDKIQQSVMQQLNIIWG